MSLQREHPSSEAQHRIALDVLGLPDHDQPPLCQCAECGRVRDDLRTLRALLETPGGALVRLPADNGSTTPEEPKGYSPESSCPQGRQPARWLLAALAAGIAAAALALIVWTSSLEPVVPHTDRWRSEAISGPEVDARLMDAAVNLQWPPTPAASWYRVSVVESSGGLLALRDLEHPCECRIALPLAEPLPNGPIYFLVEAFDGDWDRVWSRAGRLAVDGP